MCNSSSAANFEYEFNIDGHEVVYKYSKRDTSTLLNESLSIDNCEVIFFYFTSKTVFTKLEGTDTLNNSINSDSTISRVKFVNNNSNSQIMNRIEYSTNLFILLTICFYFIH